MGLEQITNRFRPRQHTSGGFKEKGALGALGALAPHPRRISRAHTLTYAFEG
jgi:hypothetical protein